MVSYLKALTNHCLQITTIDYERLERRMNILNNKGRQAGLAYLGIIVFGIFAEFGVRDIVLVKDNATATAQNIINNEGLFRLGIVSDLLMILSFFILGVLLNRMFKPLNETVSGVMFALNIIGVAMMTLNLLNQAAALFVLVEPGFLTGFDKAQIDGIAYMFMQLQFHGYNLGAIAFGTWLIPIGYMVYKERLMPRFIGIFLMLGGIEFLIVLGLQFGNPDLLQVLKPFSEVASSIGEFSFALWLLIFGIGHSKLNRKEILQNG